VFYGSSSSNPIVGVTSFGLSSKVCAAPGIRPASPGAGAAAVGPAADGRLRRRRYSVL